jgi:phage terminase small subunit
MDTPKEVFDLQSETFVIDNSETNEKLKKEELTLKKLLAKLSEKEMRFVEAYIKTLNATEAHKMTGIPVKHHDQAGYAMMQKPAVQTAIAIALKRRIEAIGLDETGVITDIKRVYDEAMKIDKLDVALKAAELLGVHIGMFQKGKKAQEKLNDRLNTEEVRKEILSTPDEEEEERATKKEKLNNILSIVQRNRSSA